MKFGTVIKLDVFYTMVTKKPVTPLLLSNSDVITCILDDAKALISDARNSQRPFTDLTEIWYLEVFLGGCFKY